MTAENKNCSMCEDFRLTLKERQVEINKLKMYIKRITSYVLESGNNLTDIKEKVKHDFKVLNNVTMKESSFYCDEFLTAQLSCYQESKSTQTENFGYSSDFSDIVEKKELAQSEVGNVHDYVYDKKYQMYYNISTGYYYDEKSGLMYEPNSCTYYRYNYDKKEYETVSQKDLLKACTDENEINFNCEAVANQVNNLNLNDDTTNSKENSHDKVENASAFQHGNSTNESGKENCFEKHLDLSEKSDVSMGCAQDWQPTEGSNLSVTDLVKQAVEEHYNMSDYIYDETHKMYYSPSTGYFYDSVRNLLYDPTSGIYYFYDTNKQTYEFYCQTETNADAKNQSGKNQESLNERRLARRKLYWKKKLELSGKFSESLNNSESHQYNDSDELEEYSSPEDGEIFSDDEEISSVPISVVGSAVKGLCVNEEKNSEKSYPPSIRAIVENSENLQIGSLILITCSGGIIGRDKKNAVYIPDICVSKLHAEIKFNTDFQTYSVEDLGSQNGTFINEKRLSDPKMKSEPCLLNHGDKLSLGSCQLLLHIHSGYDTCDNCEPGQVLAEKSNIENNAVFISKEEKETLRRQEVRRLKKKYGLQGSDFQKGKKIASSDYEDKSEIRRNTVGSDNPYEKTQEASIDVSMPETNKGYQMLKKMGWKEGQVLGATNSGLVEPIPLRPWTSKAGLGSVSNSTSFSNSTSLQGDKRSQRWVKAQERYLQLSLGSDASTEQHPDDQESMPT